MDEATLMRFLTTKRTDLSVIQQALAELPDGHPIKTMADEMNAPVSIPSVPEGPTVDDRLADIESRLAALEAK